MVRSPGRPEPRVPGGGACGNQGDDRRIHDEGHVVDEARRPSPFAVALPLLCGALVTAGVGISLMPTATGALAAQDMRSEARTYERLAIREQDDDESLVRAREMNEELAGRGAVDLSDAGAPAGYWEWEGASDDEIVATVAMPSLDIVLPVRRGTSDEALSRGVGHLPGTSLPVGGPSTHCVLAGHTDYRDLELFSRIGELGPGDVVMVTGAGGTLLYQVAQTEVVGPTEGASLAVRPGEDLLTLLTCWPPHVNTHRVLVHCERATEATPAPTTDADRPEADRVGVAVTSHDDTPSGTITAALCGTAALASGTLAALLAAYPTLRETAGPR